MSKTSDKGTIAEIRNKLDQIWDSMIVDPNQALEDSIQTEKKSIVIKYNQGIRDSRLYKGWCLIYLSRLKEAIEILTDLSGSYKNDELSEDNIKVLNALGVAYNDIGDNTNAFYFYSRSLKLSREAGLLDRELSVLNNLGQYYLENKNYNRALDHYLELLKKTENHEEMEEIRSVVLSNIGICQNKLGKYNLAEKFLTESHEISIKINDRINCAESLCEMAKVKVKMDDLDSARTYIEKSLAISREIDNKRLECDLLLMLGDIDDKVEYYHRALSLSEEIKNKNRFRKSCKKLSLYFERHDNYKESLKYIKEQYRVEKEIDNSAAERKFHNLEMEYEIERNRKNAELFKTQNLELQESLNWMTLLNKIAKDTMSTLNPDSIYNKVFQNINLLMDVTHFHVVFYNRETDMLEVVKAYDNGTEISPFTFSADEKSSFAAWVIRNRTELLINNIEKEYSRYINKRAIYGDGPLAQSSLTVPIIMRNEEIGAVAILSYHKNAYKEEHVQLLRSLAAFLSIAIDNSRNYEKVKELNSLILAEKEELEAANRKITELATHDNLTGLINRRILYEILESSMEQSKRRGETLAVLFIDLDDFKPINDTWGHDMGDKVLIEVAGRLKSSVRITDSVARIGGDEFLILLNPVKNKSESRKVAEKILENTKKPITIGEMNISIGLSIGICVFPEEETSAEQLIINADTAMYSIKKNKKNGICFFKKVQ